LNFPSTCRGAPLSEIPVPVGPMRAWLATVLSCGLI